MHTYHELLKQQYNEFKDLEEKIEKLPTTTGKGEVFEQFVFAYLCIKKDLYQISNVYRAKDIPNELRKKYHLENNDCGVDGLVILNNGKIAAYQVKFRTNRLTPPYAELAKFWIEAKYTDFNYTIANCYYLTKLAQKQEKHLNILIDEFESLDRSFFQTLHEYTTKQIIKKRNYFSPAKFQEKMISDVVEGFSKCDRGKLIAACGTGKTLTSLWISERLKTQSVLFVAPSLALIKQTLEAWSDQSRENFSYICVCSDDTVANNVEDEGDITVSDFIVPVTTNANQVTEFLAAKTDNKKVVFSTYQSLDILANANKLKPDHFFDLMIFDEAHRTAGAKNSSSFSLGLDNGIIKSKKRLFMTATERLIRPWVVKKAEEYNRVVFSMDDENLYGPVFHRFNFGEAIDQKVISDYKVIVAGISESQIYRWIQNNNLLVDMGENNQEFIESARNIFKQVLLIKSMQELPIRKVITFHNSIRNAKQFAFGSDSDGINLNLIREKMLPDVDPNNFYVDHVSGVMSAGERRQKLDQFKENQFGVVTNSRCLTEGVDVPIIDSVYFVEPRNSLIDIVQACGRALRKPRDNQEKIAYFIIPILIPEGIKNSEIINQADFEMLYSLIQSLRDQDMRLAQWIDELNFNATKGKTKNDKPGNDDPIVVSFPEEFNIEDFQDQLYLRIAEVNGDPKTIYSNSKTYGKKERKSEYKRIFKTLSDYSYQSYKDNLVEPTIRKFRSVDSTLPIDELQINHNNISHTERLGLIFNSHKLYGLTPVGKQYLNNEIIFEDLFKRQMLRHFSVVDDNGNQRILFPYRAALKILLQVKSINYIEFVFGLYGIVDSSSSSILRSVFIINKLRREYPNIQIVNKANQEAVLNELNSIFNSNYSATDIWEKKTTIYNQNIYFRNHLSLFNEIIEIDQEKRTVLLKPDCESIVEQILKQDELIENTTDKNSLMTKFIERMIVMMIFNL